MLVALLTLWTLSLVFALVGVEYYWLRVLGQSSPLAFGDTKSMTIVVLVWFLGYISIVSQVRRETLDQQSNDEELIDAEYVVLCSEPAGENQQQEYYSALVTLSNMPIIGDTVIVNGENDDSVGLLAAVAGIFTRTFDSVGEVVIFLKLDHPHHYTLLATKEGWEKKMS